MYHGVSTGRSSPLPGIDPGQFGAGRGEQPGHHGGRVGEAAGMEDCCLERPRDDNHCRQFLRFHELHGDDVVAVDLAAR